MLVCCDVGSFLAGIYQKQPTITEGLSHEQLLQLMLLADRFEVPKMQAAVATAFSAVQPQQLEWETALQLLDLPPSCAQQEEFKAVQQLAVQRLQQQLGDLEKVWANEQLQQQLLGLPFAALLQLLQHADTRVATENTVVYTIEAWYKGKPAGACSLEQLEQLLHLVRVRHCTQYYAGTVMPQMPVVQRCFDSSELSLMSVMCSAATHAVQTAGSAQCPALAKYPAWGLAQRPVSAWQPVIDWHIPLDTVKTAVQQQLDTSAPALVLSKLYTIRGQHMQVAAQVSTNDDSSSTGKIMSLGLFASVKDIPVNAVRLLSAKFTLVATAAAAPTPAAAARAVRRVTGRSQQTKDVCKTLPVSLMSADVTFGFPEFVGVGPATSWEAAEASLRQQQLMHAGGDSEGAAGPHLHVRMEVLELL
jgi:hypothetical protein